MIEYKGIDTPMSTGTKLQKVVQGELGYYLEDPTFQEHSWRNTIFDSNQA